MREIEINTNNMNSDFFMVIISKYVLIKRQSDFIWTKEFLCVKKDSVMWKEINDEFKEYL